MIVRGHMPFLCSRVLRYTNGAVRNGEDDIVVDAIRFIHQWPSLEKKLPKEGKGPKWSLFGCSAVHRESPISEEAIP